jgi:hypothetical protein
VLKKEVYFFQQFVCQPASKQASKQSTQQQKKVVENIDCMHTIFNFCACMHGHA